MAQQTMRWSLRCTPAMRAALEAIKARDGMPLSEQLRRAVQLWIAAKLPEAESAAVPTKAPRRGRGRSKTPEELQARRP